MAQLFDETIITAHRTAADLLQAIHKIDESIEKVDPDHPTREHEIRRLNRQRKILAEQYNEIIKPIRPLPIAEIDPIKLDDPVFGDRIKSHISPRCYNCLKNYFWHHHFPKKESPTMRDLFDVDMARFAILRNVGVGTMNELARFVNRLRNEMMAA